MPFERPTLSQLIDQGATEFESRLPGVLVRVRRSMIGVINRVVAGALSGLYQYAEWLNRQTWPDLSEAEYLDGHGARWGVARTPAAAATGSVTFSGTNGVLVPTGAVVQRADGAQFATQADATIAAGTAVATVAAVVPGQAGNTDTGAALSLASPIAGVNSALVAASALAGGADIEDDEPYRARILARIRQVPQGGSADDYVAWALEVPGVTRAWVYPSELGPGTVVVRFARDDDASPIPDAGEVATMQSYLDARRPVTAAVTAVAPVAVPRNFTITLTPNNAQVKAAVEAELAAAILRDSQPGGTLLVSHLREAVSIAAGETNHVMSVPSADVTHTTGQLPTMGVITWL